ncbi:MAG: DUF1761 domain-containing protein [Spirochaetes bacterium]|nr:DUF1761 domain-containing protein [Spirochaetota bacterium]
MIDPSQNPFAILNYPAILVAAVINFIIAFVWYTPLFGKKWAALVGADMSKKPSAASMAGSMIGMFVSTFIMTVGLAFFIKIAPWQCGPLQAAVIGLQISIFFIWTTESGKIFFQGKPALYFIDAGYQTIGIVISAIILGLWK